MLGKFVDMFTVIIRFFQKVDAILTRIRNGIIYYIRFVVKKITTSKYYKSTKFVFFLYNFIWTILNHKEAYRLLLMTVTFFVDNKYVIFINIVIWINNFCYVSSIYVLLRGAYVSFCNMMDEYILDEVTAFSEVRKLTMKDCFYSALAILYAVIFDTVRLYFNLPKK